MIKSFPKGSKIIDLCSKSAGEIVCEPPHSTARAAIGTIQATDNGTRNKLLEVGNLTYQFIQGGEPTDSQILLGESEEGFAHNIAEQINQNSLDTLCTAISVDAFVYVTANTPGADSNSIPLSTDDPNLIITPFNGGSD
jgi:hypothetical protein